MTALAADRTTRIRAGGYSRTIIGKVAASTKIYNGSLVMVNAAGYIIPAADAAGGLVVGIAQTYVDNSAGSNGALEVAIITCVAKLNNSSGDPVVQANMHRTCYVADDNTVRAGTGTNSIKAGVTELIESDGVWVYVGPGLNPA